MKNTNKTAVEEYLSAVFKWGLIILVSAAMSATILFNTLKIFGCYKDMPWIATIILAVMDIIFYAIAIVIVKTSFDENGYLKDGRLNVGKLFCMCIVIIQWNYLLYMLPSRTFWGFLFFFLILLAFFLDVKLVLVSGIACLASLFIGWGIRGKYLLPVNDKLFFTDVLLSVTALFLSLIGLLIFIYFVSHFLVNVKKDELERNNRHVMNVLNSVSVLSDRLHDAGQSLSQVSENESASAEELSATSEQLVKRSDEFSLKTDESIENLAELNKWEVVVADNVKQVETASRNLLDKSKENEKLLKDLHTINEQVSDSMKVTTDMSQKLSDTVEEIGETLNIINDISSSTDLLALNASIEAAKAGESGKGFAVVATEVGNLSNRTQDSLKEIEAIVDRVQNDVSEISLQVEENSLKLATQNKYYKNVFKSMRDMTELLNISVNAINTMGEAHDKQSEVIKINISLNNYIAEGIKSMTEQFDSINAMVESNANDTAEVSLQANEINSMVDEMRELLKQKD